MFLEKISWVQAQEYFEKKDIAIIPVGSTENHGSQLCLGTDFLIPRKLCEMMDERLEGILSQLKNSKVPFVRTGEPDACRYCDFKMICGR